MLTSGKGAPAGVVSVSYRNDIQKKKKKQGSDGGETLIYTQKTMLFTHVPTHHYKPSPIFLTRPFTCDINIFACFFAAL